jgi:hypothetical protein
MKKRRNIQIHIITTEENKFPQTSREKSGSNKNPTAKK